MRKVITALLIVGLTSTMAFAEWLEDFDNSNAEKGIEVAVADAIKAGITPEVITKHALTIQELNPQNIVKALYCSGANGQDVRAAAEKHGISELIITAGFQNSVEECGDQVADTQAYSENAPRRPSFAGTPSGSGGRPRRPNASPSTP
jgi:hypothetical protein